MSIFTQLISELLGILATFVMVLPYLIAVSYTHLTLPTTPYV